MSSFIQKYHELSEREQCIENVLQDALSAIPSYEARCSELANLIKAYIKQIGTSYDGDPEHKSIMLLTLMEMWMLMDMCAIEVFPLLKDYDPGFPTDILVRFTSLGIFLAPRDFDCYSQKHKVNIGL